MKFINLYYNACIRVVRLARNNIRFFELSASLRFQRTIPNAREKLFAGWVTIPINFGIIAIGAFVIVPIVSPFECYCEFCEKLFRRPLYGIHKHACTHVRTPKHQFAII